MLRAATAKAGAPQEQSWIHLPMASDQEQQSRILMAAGGRMRSCSHGHQCRHPKTHPSSGNISPRCVGSKQVLSSEQHLAQAPAALPASGHSDQQCQDSFPWKSQQKQQSGKAELASKRRLRCCRRGKASAAEALPGASPEDGAAPGMLQGLGELSALLLPGQAPGKRCCCQACTSPATLQHVQTPQRLRGSRSIQHLPAVPAPSAASRRRQSVTLGR